MFNAWNGIGFFPDGQDLLIGSVLGSGLDPKTETFSLCHAKCSFTIRCLNRENRHSLPAQSVSDFRPQRRLVSATLAGSGWWCGNTREAHVPTPPTRSLMRHRRTN